MYDAMIPYVIEQTSRGERSYDILYMWNMKRNDTNELTYKT